MTFQIHALPYDAFAPLFALTDAELAEKSARRVTADADSGFPCRVSLMDARAGETLILANHVSQPAASPYHARHAVYVRENAEQARPAPGEVPAVLRERLLSVRGFDESGMMIEADVIDGHEVAGLIEAFFGIPQVRDIHLHNARPGCFAARVTRA